MALGARTTQTFAQMQLTPKLFLSNDPSVNIVANPGRAAQTPHPRVRATLPNPPSNQCRVFAGCRRGTRTRSSRPGGVSETRRVLPPRRGWHGCGRAVACRPLAVPTRCCRDMLTCSGLRTGAGGGCCQANPELLLQLDFAVSGLFLVPLPGAARIHEIQIFGCLPLPVEFGGGGGGCSKGQELAGAA